MKMLFKMTKNSISFLFFFILNNLAVNAQPVFTAPEPVCAYDNIHYDYYNGVKYECTCVTNKKPTCVAMDEQSTNKVSVQHQSQTPTDLFGTMLVEEVFKYILTPKPTKTATELESEKQKLEAERLEKEKQARIAAENQRLINEQKAREHQELLNKMKPLAGSEPDLQMKELENTPLTTQNVLAQSLIFRNCTGDNIEIKRNGVWIKADCDNKSEMISVGETVRTGSNSTIQLTMLNLENKIQINPNTEFVYVVKDDIFNLELLYGKVRSTFKKLNKKFEVRTGSGTGGVRGTDFETIVHEDGSTEFMLYEGKIEIRPTGSESIIVLQAGQKIRIYLDGKIVGPVLLDAELTEPK